MEKPCQQANEPETGKKMKEKKYKWQLIARGKKRDKTSLEVG